MNRWEQFSVPERAVIAAALNVLAKSGSGSASEVAKILERECDSAPFREIEPRTFQEAIEKGRRDYLRVTGQSE
jgi:hypothetical protein